MTLDEILRPTTARARPTGKTSPHPWSRKRTRKPDASIAVAWGLSDAANGDYGWDWVKIYPDGSAYKFFIDLLYNGVPVHRQLAVAVDGGRANLPSPVRTLFLCR